jgi:RimJ/RimL family protein N-acetyltransferase
MSAAIRLETASLILRPWEERDREPLADIQCDPLVRRFFPRAMTRQEAFADFDLSIEKARVNGFHTQAAELKSTGELVGLIGLGSIPDFIAEAIPSRPKVEIGWVLAPRFWGRGLAPEGAAAWLDHAWSIGIDEVVATTARINQPSQRVMQKLGMTYDPADDYERPTVPEGHPIRPHLIYRMRNPNRANQSTGPSR